MLNGAIDGPAADERGKFPIVIPAGLTHPQDNLPV